jgi:hypothetical protein
LDGKWFLVDATWGAGSVDNRQFRKQFTDYYFLTPPEQLIFTHLPEEAKWQLRKPPLSLNEFNRRPTIGSTLFEMGVTADAVERVLVAQPMAGIVKTFSMPDGTSATGTFPIERSLRSGSDCRFEFKSDDFVSFALIQDRKFTYLKRQNGVFRGTLRPHAGPLQIGAKVRGDSRGYAILLEYSVE